MHICLHHTKLGGSVLISYQFGVAPVVQYKVLRFEVSVDYSFGMQVGESLYHTSCVKPGGWVLKWTPGNTGQQSLTVNKVIKDADKYWLRPGRWLQYSNNDVFS